MATLALAAQDSSSAITAYKIYQDGTEIATVAGNILTYNVSGLTRSTTYTFQVQAGNAEGAWSADGPETAVTTRSGSSGRRDNSPEEPPTPPAAPTAPTPPDQPQSIIHLTIGQRYATINGSLNNLEVAPFIDPSTGRTLIPIRFISEILGAAVNWDPATRQIRITLGETEIILILDSRTAFVNGQGVQLDQPPVILPPGRTFVPLRFISETLGAAVEYDGTTGQISIFR